MSENSNVNPEQDDLDDDEMFAIMGSCESCDAIAQEVSDQHWYGIETDRAGMIHQSLLYWTPRLIKMRENRVGDDPILDAAENFVEAGLAALTRVAEGLSPER